jgi:hypothetical protein
MQEVKNEHLSFSALSITKCEQKMQDLMLASEKINYPNSAQAELSSFKFKKQGTVVTGEAMIFVYNGDTRYVATGHTLPLGHPDDCAITNLAVEVFP